MASSTERLLALALVVGATGCFSGHLLDAARRRDLPAALVAVGLDGDDVVVTMRTRTVTDLDRPAGCGMTRARVRLDDLARNLPVEDLPVRFERAGPPHPGRPLLVLTSDAVSAPVPVARLDEGPAPALTIETREATYPPLHLVALTRHRYEPWAWLLMPGALAVDAVTVPPLLFFAPAVIMVGD